MAIFGAGAIGRVHAANVAAERSARLVWIIDQDRTRAETLATEHGASADVSIETALSDPRVDAVIIASSTSVHHEHVLAVAAAGKALLCEKPIADSLDRAAECLKGARDAGVVAAIGFNRRLDTAYAAIYDRVRAGTIGKVETLHIVSRSSSAPPPESVAFSGGMLREKGTHFYDLAAWLTGSEPVEVFAMGACLVDPKFAKYQDVDTAAISLRFENGAIATFSFGRRTAYGYEETLEVFGEGGLLETRRHRPMEVALYKGRSVTEDGIHPGWFERFANTYRAELKAFLAAVRGELPVHASLADGLRAQVVAEASIESMSRGCAVSLRRQW